MYFKKIISISVLVLMVAGCVNPAGNSGKSKYSAQQISEKETFLQSSGDYRGLIALYREILKNGENEMIRYKLAESYYYNGDSKSSNFYLEPLIASNNRKLSHDVFLLRIKNDIQLNQYQRAITHADSYLKINAKDGQAYNLRGIAYAHLGNLDQAYHDIMSARERFISDSVAINNLAMLNILDKQYKNAVNLLLPQYLNGEREPRLIYNLVFALVKSGDLSYAKDIIQKEKLNTSPDQLIIALQKTEKNADKVKR
ncbi:tight adherence protein D [Pasteurella testudinis DSM 23072]|uniref:Tight adherence protein D n=1 Tax=Pasteurella testudinis DSM 23072 TaxID=1122938 RepID=A0A1W1UD65_9PAST|nr:tight adherence protein D [Pasteurella testudinis DSM 23072]SUB52447.1 nonspecific tight adherence protein D [Pasteurella testudinis]